METPQNPPSVTRRNTLFVELDVLPCGDAPLDHHDVSSAVRDRLERAELAWLDSITRNPVFAHLQVRYVGKSLPR